MRNKTMFLTYIIVIFLMIGCSSNQENPTVTPHDVTESLQMENENRQASQYVNQEIQENLFIDAEVIIPSDQQYSTHTLRMVDCDPDRLFGIFCPGGIESYTAEDLRKDHGHIIYHESSGKELIIYENSISCILRRPTAAGAVTNGS